MSYLAPTTQISPSSTVVRKAIADLISAALEAYYLQTPNPAYPKVYDHWILNHRLGATAAPLRADHGATENRIHCWMVGTNEVLRTSPDKTLANATQRTQGAGRRDITQTYRVWAYHEMYEGDAELETTTNSEATLLEEIEWVSDYFSKNRSLGLDSYNFYRGHDELQFRNIDVYEFGECAANVAQGTLVVHLYRNIT